MADIMKPSSNTGISDKNELGAIRAIYGANILHYAFSSYVQGAFENKLSDIPHTNLNKRPDEIDDFYQE
jgi:hypothetical protein